METKHTKRCRNRTIFSKSRLIFDETQPKGAYFPPTPAEDQHKRRENLPKTSPAPSHNNGRSTKAAAGNLPTIAAGTRNRGQPAEDEPKPGKMLPRSAAATIQESATDTGATAGPDEAEPGAVRNSSGAFYNIRFLI